MVSMGRLDVFRFANLWTHRAQFLGCISGMVEACRAFAVDWRARVNSRQDVQRSISLHVESHYSVSLEVGEFKHATSERASWMSIFEIFSAPRCLSFLGTGLSARLRLAHWRNG